MRRRREFFFPSTVVFWLPLPVCGGFKHWSTEEVEIESLVLCRLILDSMC